MTPQELIDAVRSCLPLTTIDEKELDVGYTDPPSVWLDRRWRSMMEDAEVRIIGAIARACAERGWIVQQDNGRVTVWTGIEWEQRHDADGTDALAWCRAYAQAKEATK